MNVQYTYQYIKILRVCVSVSDGSGMFVGAGLDYSDTRPSYFTEPRTPRRMFENIGPGRRAWAGIQYAIGEQQPKRAREQQLKRTQSGRSSSSESCPAPDYAR